MTSSSVFPREEFVERRKRTREALGRRNVDTLLVLSERNWYRDHAIRYLTGYDCPTSFANWMRRATQDARPASSFGRGMRRWMKRMDTALLNHSQVCSL